MTRTNERRTVISITTATPLTAAIYTCDVKSVINTISFFLSFIALSTSMFRQSFPRRHPLIYLLNIYVVHQ